MNQRTPEDKRKYNQNRKRVQEKEKRNIIIIVSVIVALLVFAGIAYLVTSFKNKKAQEAFVPVNESTTVELSTNAEPPQETEAPSSQGETTMSVGDVKIEDYQATMFSTTTTLNVRSAPSSDSGKLGMIGQDTPIKVTGKCSNGWMRIDYNGTIGYCSAQYLSGSQNQSDAPYMIKVNRKQNIVIIYAKDEYGGYTKPYKAMVCSVGLDNATPTGTWTTTDKYEWRLLSGNVYGQYATRITGHYLFHSVPYFKQSKSDLEYDEYNKLGQPASLGCIRLSVEDAKWIYDNCPKNTTVTIYDSDEQEPLAKPTPITIDTNDSRKGWDPTDPDKSNPWKN